MIRQGSRSRLPLPLCDTYLCIIDTLVKVYVLHLMERVIYFPHRLVWAKIKSVKLGPCQVI